MQTGKRKIIIICLITLLMVCQLLPAILFFSKYVDGQASAESLLFTGKSFNHSVPALDTSASRPVFQKVPVNQFHLDFYKVDPIWSYSKSPMAFFQIVDIRRTIIETIPQQFYGSKYKTSCFSA